MANYLILNKNQVFNGLGTLTYTVATTEPLNVQVQVSFPEAQAINSANADQSVYQGAGSGVGLGSGAGASQTGDGFGDGDLGLGHGAPGRGFGSVYPYPQPPVYGSNATAASPVLSQLSIVVNKNGSPIYTSTLPAGQQSGLKFKTSFLAAAADSITVVFSSSASADNQLSGITSNVSVGQGL